MEREIEQDPPLKLRERAYDAFTRHLLDRDLAPGQFVSQRELVDMPGLTLGAIRELIPRLESEGLIRTVPKRGMQIAQVDLAPSVTRSSFACSWRRKPPPRSRRPLPSRN